MKSKLLWQGVRKIPNIFSDKEIELIFKSILNSNNYWSKKGYKDWGEFLRFRDLTLIATIYYLGLRPNEACSLKLSDFNIANSTVLINGKNNKCHKDRLLPLPKRLIDIYTEYLKFERYRFWHGSKYLFPSFSSEHIHPGRLKAIFREKALKPFGLWKMPENNKISPTRLYTLRHTFASRLLNKQIEKHGQPDLFAISNLLGHSDIRSSSVYLHTDSSYMEYLRKEIE